MATMIYFKHLILLAILPLIGYSSAKAGETSQRLALVVQNFQNFCGRCHTDSPHTSRNFLSLQDFSSVAPEVIQPYTWNLSYESFDSYLMILPQNSQLPALDELTIRKNRYLALRLIERQADIMNKISWQLTMPGEDHMPPQSSPERLELIEAPEAHDMMVSFLFFNLFVLPSVM